MLVLNVQFKHTQDFDPDMQQASHSQCISSAEL